MASFIFVFLSFVSVYTVAFISNFEDTSVNGVPGILSGKIMSVESAFETGRSLLLTDAKIIGEDESIVALKGNVTITIYCDGDEDSLKEYSRIFVETTVDYTTLLDGQNNIQTYLLKSNIKYIAKSVNSNKIVKIFDEANIIESFRLYNKNLLLSSLGSNRGEVAYSILYGDTSHVEDNLLTSFRTTGVAHIFAVSGLHVSLLALLLSFVLNKLKTKDYVNFIITTLSLFLFCLLCSFSSSTVRATIMTLVLLFGRLISRHYDPIGSISFAGVILLITSPMNLFNLGFLLSFGAVFGILLLNPIFRKLKFKNEILNKVYSLLSITICAQLGTLPAMSAFLSIPTYSIIANILLIPIFSFFYTLLFIVNLIVLVLPYLKFLYIIPRAFLEGIIYINHLITLLPYSSISVGALGFKDVIFYFLTLFVAGRLLVTRPLVKTLSTLLLVLVTITSITLSSLPYKAKSNKITFYDSSSAINCLLETKNGKLYLINPDMQYSSTLSKKLHNMNIYNLDGVILLKQNKYNLSYFCENISLFSPTIYMGDNSYGYKTFDSYNLKHAVLTSSIIDDTLKLEFLKEGSDVLAVVISLGNYKIAYFSDYASLDDSYMLFIKSNFDFNLSCAIIDRNENDFFNILKVDNIFFSTSIIQSFVM